ncbi:MAG: T9SS type A sorting domain-containing protein [Bacteroidales bacterium]|jgi:hypothetical protein|nr:T9SS type A sorting domain-containing protein [Bacteroidales bacterium]
MKSNYLLKMMLAGALMFSAATAQPAEISVDSRDALQNAIDNATADDVILVTASFEVNNKLWLKKVHIKGVGDNIEIKAAAGYTWRLYDLINEGAREKAIIENITFSGADNQGNAEGNEKDGGTGRIGANAEFINCKWIGNKSVERGGAIDIYAGEVLFTNCEFTGNISPRGGALVVRSDNTLVTLVNCKFSGNETTTDRGAAFFIQSASTVRVINSIISGNINRGNGGTAFTTDGNPTLYVEGSSVIGNESHNSHGCVLYAMGQGNITFVNTTIAGNIMHNDANSMLFLDATPTLRFINSTVAGNKAGTSGGPNAGNTTGIGIMKPNTNLVVHNSIIVGNTANNGEAVDIKYQSTDNFVPGTLDIKNSIIGWLQVGVDANTLPEADIAASKDEASIVNEYARTSQWQASEKSGIIWSGLQQTSRGSYYALNGKGKAVGLADPALLAAALNLTETTALPDQLGYIREVKEGKIDAGAVAYPGYVGVELDIDQLNYTPDGTSYDVATHTITYSADWRYAGWEWAELKDFSKFTSITIEFDASCLPGPAADPEGDTKIQGIVVYENGRTDGDEEVEVRNHLTSITIPLGIGGAGGSTTPADKSKVWRVGLKSQTSGTIVLKRAYATAVDETITELPLDNLNLKWGDGITNYDNVTHTVTYIDHDWDGGIGWELAPQDYSDYYAAVLEFEPSETGFNLHAQYVNAGHGNDGDHDEYVEKGATKLVLELNNERKSATIKFFMQFKGSEGTAENKLVLKRAYLVKQEPDLTVTEVTWTPESPEPGQGVTFSAKVKNIGYAPTPAVKHGLTFTTGGVTVWSDTHLTPLAPNEEITLTANGGGTDGKWIAGKNPKYKVVANINDDKTIATELDFSNNSKEAELIINGKPDLKIDTIRMSPSDPSAGEEIEFRAAVRNIGTVNTAAGTIHRVKFTIGSTVVEGTFTGQILAGASSVTNIAGTWTMVGDNFTVTGEVNPEAEGARIEESDYTNNSYTYVYAPSAIDDVWANATVYTQGQTLYIEGYAGASVGIYNLLGQEVASLTAIAENAAIELTSGAYIVKIAAGKVMTHKVLIK